MYFEDVKTYILHLFRLGTPMRVFVNLGYATVFKHIDFDLAYVALIRFICIFCTVMCDLCLASSIALVFWRIVFQWNEESSDLPMSAHRPTRAWQDCV